MAYSFDPEETVAEAFARTAREQLDAAEEALTTRLPSDPVTAVHDARKAVKKTRALLRLTRGAVDDRQRRRANAALRDAGRHLSATRDAEVMLAGVDGLAKRYSGQVPHTTFTMLRKRLEDERVPAGRPGDAPERRAAAELAAVRDRIAGWELRDDGWGALDRGIVLTYERGTSAFARARRKPTTENLHEWRKHAKDLWYALRLLSATCGPVVVGAAADAALLCDLLGEDHDLGVLHETLARVGHDVAADLAAVLGLIEHRRAELRARAMIVGARVYAESPKAFRRRVRTYWNVGRDEARAGRGHQPVKLASVTRIHHAA